MPLAVQRVLDSSTFQRAYRLSQLLAYMTERSLERDFDSLKEHVIGQRVFNRPAAYNSAEDNIVRSNIHQLRLKLGEYYATAGAADPWRIAVPKGSYGLVVEQYPPVEPSVTESRGAEFAAPPTPAARTWPVRRIAISSSMAVIAAAIVLAVYLGGKPVRAAKADPPNCLLRLLAPNPGQRLTVVVPDANLQLYQRLTGRTVLLQDYVKRRFLKSAALRQVSPALAGSADALFRSSITQSFVLDVIPRFAQVVPAATLSVRNPEALSMKDFEKDNAVLISGPYGDPWVQLFDRDLNFEIETNEGNRRAHIVDRYPEGSEKKEYYNFVDRSNTTVCYARIAYLPGLTVGTHVLLAGGPHVASTEAACLFLTRRESIFALQKLFHLTSARHLPYFELLIEARALGNAPWKMKIVAGRTVAGK
ncbi:MAG: hypothetical protein ACRD4O_02940 [Bryobacteraceae bacterium]